MGIGDLIISASTADGGQLTEEALMRTMDAVMQPPRPHAHIIPSRSEPGAWALCSDCRQLVRVPEDWPA